MKKRVISIDLYKFLTKKQGLAKLKQGPIFYILILLSHLL